MTANLQVQKGKATSINIGLTFESNKLVSKTKKLPILYVYCNKMLLEY